MKTTEAATGCVLRKGVLKLKFSKFHRKKPELEFLFNKSAGVPTCSFIKERSNTGLFLHEHSKIFKNSYFEGLTLENEIFSCFFMSKVIHKVLEKVKKEY